jgi:hypothetical protein
MKLYRALIELLEAKAENIREDTATMQLGKFAEGYDAGRADSLNFEVIYTDETEDD